MPLGYLSSPRTTGGAGDKLPQTHYGDTTVTCCVSLFVTVAKAHRGAAPWIWTNARPGGRPFITSATDTNAGCCAHERASLQPEGLVSLAKTSRRARPSSSE